MVKIPLLVLTRDKAHIERFSFKMNKKKNKKEKPMSNLSLLFKSSNLCSDFFFNFKDIMVMFAHFMEKRNVVP